eukprot:m.64404 g.64404  ORF g.64404 m.64404 type:complete len:651 (+) comp35250_c0_seq3:23-1975(+)
MKTVVAIIYFLFFQTRISHSQVWFVPAETKSSWWRTHFGSESDLDPSTCPPREKPGNGSVSISGNIAVYSCDDDYTLVGGSQRHCSCGKWIGSNPICRRNGAWGEWGPSSDCSVTCNRGKKTRRRLCDEPIPEEGGKTCPGSSTEATICNDIPCPGCPLSQNVILGPLIVTVLDDKRHLKLACAERYDRVGEEVVVCTEDGVPNANDICLPSCSNLTSSLNGVVNISSDGRLATYECEIGYALEGSRTRQCSEEGQWSGSEVSCVEGGTVGIGGGQLGDSENVTVSLVGAKPEIALPPGEYQVNTPDFLAVNCSVVITFNYRTSSKSDGLFVIAKLISFNTNDLTDENRKTAALSLSAEGKINITRSQFTTRGCLQLTCVNATLLPAVSFVRLSVKVPDGFFEIRDIFVDEQLSCQDNEDDTETADCDNTTTSGDCGYRSTSCSVHDWELTMDEDTPVVPLRIEATAGENCKYDVCLSCLVDSGFSVSQEGEAVRRRKKRRVVGFRKGFRKSFCLLHKGKKVSPGQYRTKPVKINAKNQYFAFDYSMFAQGMHHLVVNVRCKDGGNSIVRIGKEFSYSIGHFHGRGLHGKACLDLHHYIYGSYEYKRGFCRKFSVEIEGCCLASNLCIRNTKFLKQKDVETSSCRKIDNR